MKDKKAIEFETLVRQELSELYDYAYGTPKTPENATDLALAQSYYEDLREELRQEFFGKSIEDSDLMEVSEQAEVSVIKSSASKMYSRAGRMISSAKKFIDNVGDHTRAALASIEVAQASLEDEVLAVSGVRLDGFIAKAARRDGSRKKELVNVDRQAKFTAGAVNFEERVSSQRRRHQEQTRREAARLTIRAKQVS